VVLGDSAGHPIRRLGRPFGIVRGLQERHELGRSRRCSCASRSRLITFFGLVLGLSSRGTGAGRSDRTRTIKFPEQIPGR
jgi:hypothetical protein